MTYELHDYQKLGVSFLQNQPKVGLFLDMGLGKTATVLSALTPDRLPALVVAPKRVAEETWPDERDIWRPDLDLALAAGSPADRKAALAAQADIIVLGRDNMKELAPYRNKFNTFVVDESSGYKNPGSSRFKVADAVSRRTDNVWLLSGTPSPNGYADIWSQIFLLDEGKRLGHNITAFREKYMYVENILPTGARIYALHDFAEAEIRQRIEDICLYMDSEGRVELPSLAYPEHKFSLSKGVMQFYRRLKDDMVADMEEIGLVVSADNAGILSNRLSQIAAGFVYEYLPEDPTRYTRQIHFDRVEVVKELIEAAQSPCLVAYRYQEERDRLLALPGAHSIHEKNIVKRWNAGDVPILVAHPASVGHGLNLQHGGHHIIWSSPDWPLELWQQFNKRLHRQGQKHPVVVHKVVAKGTTDTIIYNRLEKKTTNQQSLLNHLLSPV